MESRKRRFEGPVPNLIELPYLGEFGEERTWDSDKAWLEVITQEVENDVADQAVADQSNTALAEDFHFSELGAPRILGRKRRRVHSHTLARGSRSRGIVTTSIHCSDRCISLLSDLTIPYVIIGSGNHSSITETVLHGRLLP
jgi:hypothetical protein